MKRTFKLLFLVVALVLGMANVKALTPAEKQAKIEAALAKYTFHFKYANMDDDFAMVTKARGENSWPDPEQAFLDYLVRNDLEKNIPGLDLGMDVMCHRKGEEYEVYYEDHSETKVAATDLCQLYIVVDEDENNSYGFSTEITGAFEEVEGNANYKKEALKIATDLQKNFYVNDMDIINHIFNYKSSTATFFQNNNVTTEFSDIKKAVEANPDYDIFVGLEEVRRGDYFVGLEEGGTYIARDGIIYGYALHTYGAGTLFYVPAGTPESDYIKTVEKRIKDYLNDDSIEIKIERTQYRWSDDVEEHVYDYVDSLDLVLDMTGMKKEDYFKAINTTNEKQLAKMHEDDKDYCEEYGCLATPMYNLTVGDQKLEIGIIEVPESFLQSNGLTTSVNKKTGIMIRTASANVPLDAILDIKELELTDEEKAYLSNNGFKEIKSYDLSLFSKILNKYIEKFNTDSEILIPVTEKNDKLKVVYISDDLKTLEEYDIEYVEIGDQLYMSFKTKHFSNYIIVEEVEIPADTENEPNPPSGDGILTSVGVSLISMFAISGLIITKKKETNN